MASLGNPLTQIIDNSCVSYKRGGVFSLKFIKSNLKYGDYDYMDYEILVEDVKNEDDYNRLMKI